MSTDKRIIAVIGATGAQGGGLVRAIMADANGPFTARAITRDPQSEKAKALAALGAEVVHGDVDDAGSIEAAFRGAHGAFCVTPFWAHMDADREFTEASHLAHAAKGANVEHVIWSTLEDTRTLVPLSDPRMPTLGGKYKVPHFDAKGEADAVFRTLGVPTTFLLASFYWENFIYFGMGPKKGADGALAITLPMGKARLAGIAAEDIGKCAYGILKRGAAAIGQTVGIAGGHQTGDELAAGFAHALGQPVTYNEITPETFRGFGFPGADDLGNMFQIYRDFESVIGGVRNVETSRALNPALQTFEQWLADNAKRIPLA